ncbi:MAG TPA: MFS transporter [Pedomonas sp.]|uniref:MFS transporter n=1 Tax=Pedomonas sp. TaxID=2976421 RepID=UPI002F4279FA
MPRRLAAIAAISFGTALVVLDGAIATVALPTIAADLGVESSSVVGVVTVYQLILVMLLLPFSGLGERIGLKRLFQIGQLVFTVATALCFFAGSLPFLLIVRAAQAVGAAAVLSVASALIRSIYPRDQLGRGMGINSVVVSISAALAPSLGGLVLSVAPWPWVFASAVPFALLSLAFGRALPDVGRRLEPYDVLSALLCALMFGLIIGGIESGVHGDSPVVSIAVVLAGLAIGAVFVRRQQGEAKPILPVDLLAKPVLALSTLGAFTAFLASMTIFVTLPFRLQMGYGMTPSEVGAVIAPWPLTMMLVAPLSGWLSDRYPAGILGSIGMAIAFCGLLTLAFLPAEPSLFDIGWRMAFSSAGFAMFLSPNARLVVGSAPIDRAAAAGGLIATTRMLGQTCGATLAAALLAVGIGATLTPPLIAAGLALVAGVCSLARLRPSLREPKKEEADHFPSATVR